jgi:hypothetical protein
MQAFDRLRELLEKIKEFGHTEDCNRFSVPVHECVCYGDKDERWLANEALKELDILEDNLR